MSDTPRQKQHRTVENARLKSTSLSQRALTHVGNLVLIGKNKFFREVKVAWTEAYGQGYVHDAIHWFLHKIKIDLVDNLRAVKATARLMCPATAPLLNPTAAGIRHGWSDCARSCQPTLRLRNLFHLKLSDSMADLAAKKVHWWRQSEDNLPHWAGAVKMALLVQRFSAGAGRVFSLLRTAFSDQQQAAFKIMWRPAMLRYNHCRDNNVDVFELTS